VEIKLSVEEELPDAGGHLDLTGVRVRGTLSAVGTETDSIRFIPHQRRRSGHSRNVESPKNPVDGNGSVVKMLKYDVIKSSIEGESSAFLSRVKFVLSSRKRDMWKIREG